MRVNRSAVAWMAVGLVLGPGGLSSGDLALSPGTVIEFGDGSTVANRAELIGPQGPQGEQGPEGPQGPHSL